MALLRMFIRRSVSTLLWAAMAGVVSGSVTTALIALVNWVLRSGTHASVRLVMAFAALCAVRLASGVLSHVLLIRLSQGAIFELRTRLCGRILQAPLRQLEVLGNARLNAAFSDDMVQIATVVINLPYMFVNCIILAGSLVYLGWLSWSVLIGIGGCMALGATSYLLPVTWANQRLRQARKEQDGLFAAFRDLTQGAKELKLHAPRRRAFLSDVLTPAADSVRRHSIAGITVYATVANWGRLLFFVYVGLVLFALPALVPLSSVALAGYVLVILYMMAPLEAVMNVLPHVAQANVALGQIESLGLSLFGESEGQPGLVLTMPRSSPHLTLAGVTYTYRQKDNHAFELGPIDMVLQPGQITFLTGGNGSGKTTLAKLICGLYVPDAGQVLIGDCPVADASREAYRQRFSVVFSDCHVFDALIGLEASGLDGRASEHLSQLELGGKLEIKNGRLSTTALSQGQRKRLALLVALLEDRPIYLFDEWAADQDPQFKRVFYHRVLPQLRDQGRIVLAITHDDRFYDVADQILKLDDGRLTTMTRDITGAASLASAGR